MIVKHTKPFITYVAVDLSNIYFFPGMNTVTPEQAALLSESEDFQNKVKTGLFQIIDNNAEAIPATAAKAAPTAVKAAVKIASKVTISNMNITNAVKTVEGIFNRAELERLATTDQRKGVQDAIKRQLEAIKPDPAPAEEN